MTKLCFFDLDGTLVDTSQDIAAAANHVRQHYDQPEASLESIMGWVGDGIGALVRRALSSLSLSTDELDSAADRCRDFYRSHVADASRPYDGIIDCLDRLSSKTLVVLTNKPQVLSDDLLDQLGLSDRFAAIYGPEAFPEMKPSPVPLETCLRRFEVSKQEAVMIGDSAQDILAGKNAGVWTIGVTWGFRHRGVLEKTGADSLVDRPSQIADLILAREDA